MAAPESSIKRREQGRRLMRKHWQVVFNDRPDRWQINVEVVMHQNIAHPHNLPPRQIRRKRTHIGGNGRRCLANDQQVVNNLRLDQLTLREGVLSLRSILIDSRNCLQHIA